MLQEVAEIACFYAVRFSKIYYRTSNSTRRRTRYVKDKVKTKSDCFTFAFRPYPLSFKKMSLQYEKETEQPQTPAEHNENFQKAASVLPIYSIILVVCLIAVSACQFWVERLGFDFDGRREINFARRICQRGIFRRTILADFDRRGSARRFDSSGF